jgi:hypothetical protein
MARVGPGREMILARQASSETRSIRPNQHPFKRQGTSLTGSGKVSRDVAGLEGTDGRQAEQFQQESGQGTGFPAHGFNLNALETGKSSARAHVIGIIAKPLSSRLPLWIRRPTPSFDESKFLLWEFLLRANRAGAPPAPARLLSKGACKIGVGSAKTCEKP